MNIKGLSPLIKALLVALLLAGIGWIGLDIPPSAVEETVDAQFDNWWSEEGTGEETAGVVSSPVPVTRIIDGDTADVILDGETVRLRFIGIDTPETEYSPAGAECYGEKATTRARELLADQTIVIQTDDTQAAWDRNGRLLVYAALPDGRDFGEVMLVEGYAYEYTYTADYAYQARYQTAEDEARASARGLWAACQ